MAYERKEVILTKDDETIIFATLDAAGQHIGVSRERIRQLASQRSNLHKKSGYKINYGKLILGEEDKHKLMLETGLNEGQIEYKERIFKHYKNNYFVASNSSYIVISTKTVRYEKPTFGTRYRIGQEYIYRIVANLWIPNPENKEEVDHIAGLDKGHGIDNIRWATHKENCGAYSEPFMPEFSNYMIEGNDKVFASQTELAEFLDCNQSLISKVLNPRHVNNKTARGLTIKRVAAEDTTKRTALKLARIDKLEKMIKNLNDSIK